MGPGCGLWFGLDNIGNAQGLKEQSDEPISDAEERTLDSGGIEPMLPWEAGIDGITAPIMAIELDRPEGDLIALKSDGSVVTSKEDEDACIV